MKIRKLISELIPIFFLIGILLLIFSLSAPILPPIELLVIILFLVTVLIVLRYSWFVRFHARLKINFLQAMKKRDVEIVKESMKKRAVKKIKESLKKREMKHGK